MGRPRELDWNEVRRVYSQVRTYYGTAKILGCAAPTVRRIIDPEFRERKAVEQKQRRRWVGECVDCGGPATRRQPSTGDRVRNGRCNRCAALAKADSVRADTLRCSCCRLWLVDDDFPRQAANISRRERHAVCRPCQTIVKRDHRQAHPEQERAAVERRKARRRARRSA